MSTFAANVDDLRGWLDALLEWVRRNGYAGWDPYDLWDTPSGSYARATSAFGRRAARFLISRSAELWPIGMRRLLGARPGVNAKAMGLFAAAYLRLEAIDGRITGSDGEPAYAACFRWLEANRVATGDGVGWGYPFDWQSRVLIPRGTPTVVTTAIIGDAYWLRYRLHGDGASLARCEDICRFILGRLNRSPGPAGTFCFSYTPIDQLEVHNANLLGAEFLVRIGTELGRADWVNAGLVAARFSLGQTRDDGTLSYWSDAQSAAAAQDTYHAGFEIRALSGIADATGIPEFRCAADRYFQTWRRDYFEPDGTPCFLRASRNVIEVHSVAEALLCTAKMRAGGHIDDRTFWDGIVPALDAARSLWIQVGPGAGYFGPIRRRRYGVWLRPRIPFVRWGQAWMAAALTAVLERAVHDDVEKVLEGSDAGVHQPGTAG